MPFTFSHPALMLPLLNKRSKLFSATGLVIGSIIPDFESFITLNEYKWHSHTWSGAFWFDLPLALLASFIFHYIVRNSLIQNLPDDLGNKFIRVTTFEWFTYFRKHFFVVITSMLIGILSHLLWDAFTHLNLKFPDSRASAIYVHNTRLYMILQYTNSAIGLLIVGWYIWRLPILSVSKPGHSKNVFYIGEKMSAANKKGIYWTILSAIATAAIALDIHFSPGYITGILLIEIFISAVLLALILTPLLQKAIGSR